MCSGRLDATRYNVASRNGNSSSQLLFQWRYMRLGDHEANHPLTDLRQARLIKSLRRSGNCISLLQIPL